MTATFNTTVPAVPTIAACPECNVVLLTTLENIGGRGVRFVAVALGVCGVICCFINLVGGLVLLGLSLIVSAVAGKRVTLLRCPNCGAQGSTLPEIALKVEQGISGPSRISLVIELIVGAMLGLLVWYFLQLVNHK